MPRVICTNRLSVLLLAACLCAASGCTWLTALGTSHEGQEYGKTYFVGGAGSLGTIVGTGDVPWGLRRAGYQGAIEVYGWQAVIGGTLRDQMDRSRNESEGRRLAKNVRSYMDKHPGRPVNLIALSAGTGVATWALEALPPRYQVHRVVYLSSSLSRTYDLSAALRHVYGRLYCFYSERDPVLRFLEPIAGSVDRKWLSETAAGLEGFAIPPDASPANRDLYASRLANVAYRDEYAGYGYFGLHADSTASSFIQHVIAPLLMRPLDQPDPDEITAEALAKQSAPPPGAPTLAEPVKKRPS